jgi:hypothetical protein
MKPCWEFGWWATHQFGGNLLRVKWLCNMGFAQFSPIRVTVLELIDVHGDDVRASD